MRPKGFSEHRPLMPISWFGREVGEVSHDSQRQTIVETGPTSGRWCSQGMDQLPTTIDGVFSVAS
jgi:hypothetical protein